MTYDFEIYRTNFCIYFRHQLNIRLFTRLSFIFLNLAQHLPTDFQILTEVGIDSISPGTAMFGVYFTTVMK